ASCFARPWAFSISQSYHGARKIPRGEWRKIIHALTDADEMHRQPKFFSNRHQNAAPRSPIELGHHQPSYACGLAENLHLTERVLTNRRIEHKQHSVRSCCLDLTHYTHHFFQLAH